MVQFESPILVPFTNLIRRTHDCGHNAGCLMTVAVTLLDAENSVSNWLSPCSPAPAHTGAHSSVVAAAMQVRVHAAGVPSKAG
jgi:hypothetical protein